MDRWDSVTEAVKVHHAATVAPVKGLIGAANFDLYYGPSVPDEEYPGFVEAVDLIDNQLSEVEEIWFDLHTEEVFTSEPGMTYECTECNGGDDSDCDCGGRGYEDRFMSGDLFYVDRAEVFRILLGRELASYL